MFLAKYDSVEGLETPPGVIESTSDAVVLQDPRNMIYKEPVSEFENQKFISTPIPMHKAGTAQTSNMPLTKRTLSNASKNLPCAVELFQPASSEISSLTPGSKPPLSPDSADFGDINDHVCVDSFEEIFFKNYVKKTEETCSGDIRCAPISSCEMLPDSIHKSMSPVPPILTSSPLTSSCITTTLSQINTNPSLSNTENSVLSPIKHVEPCNSPPSLGKRDEDKVHSLRVDNNRDDCFCFNLTSSEWNSIKPGSLNSCKFQKLTGQWTNIFGKKIAEHRPGCAVIFYRNKVKKQGSRKRNANFFTGEGRCKDPSCCKYRLFIVEDPDDIGQTEVHVQQLGTVAHTQKLRKRPLTKDDRTETGDKIKQNGISNTYYQLISDTKEEQIKDGNITNCQTRDVLRTLAAETRRAELFHNNIQVELLLTKAILKDEDTESLKIKGYIRFLSWSPFVVILFTEQQLMIYKDRQKKGDCNVYLDATGSLVRQLPGEGPVYYYALVLPHEDKGHAPVPLCEMVSSCQRTSIITLFLQTWNQCLADIGCLKVCPNKVETDFSWALIHSTLTAFNKENIQLYLRKCWEICNGTRNVECPRNWTVLHLCCSHFVKMVHRRLSSLVKDQGLKEFILRVVAVLQNTRSLRYGVKLWNHLSELLNSHSINKTVQGHVDFLKEAINNQGDYESEPICNLQINCDDLSNVISQGGTIRKQSPFVSVFSKIPPSADEKLDGMQNLYFAPSVETFLRTDLMPLYPLWSGVMLGDLLRHATGLSSDSFSRDSNAIVECWMRIVKHDTLQGKRRMPVGVFVRKMHVVLKGRLKAFRYSLPMSTGARKRKSTSEQFDFAKEVWASPKVKKTKHKKYPKYFSPPQKMPTPKNRFKSTELKSNPGLINRQNTCWMNSALQAVKTWINTSARKDVSNFVSEIQSVIKQLNEGSRAPVGTDSIIECIRCDTDFKQLLPIGDQHDTCVFLEYLTQHLKEFDMFPSINMTSQYKCSCCKQTRTVNDQMLILPLALTESRWTEGINSCINKFFADEALMAVECPSCKRRTRHIKSTQLDACPEVMIIQLKRFSDMGVKLKSRVKICRNIDFCPYVKEGSQSESCNMVLAAAQCHVGDGIYSGHYWTVVPTKDLECVRKYDDSSVTVRGNDFLDSKRVQADITLSTSRFTRQGGFVYTCNTSVRPPRQETIYVLHYVRENGGIPMQRGLAGSTVSDMKGQAIGITGEDVLLEKNGYTLHRCDLNRLMRNQRITDSVINIYLQLLAERNNSTDSLRNIFPFNTFFYCKLLKCGCDGVQRWVKRDNITNCALMLFPIHLDDHWCLAVAENDKNVLTLYDPLGINNVDILDPIRNYLEFQVSGKWITRMGKGYPLQTNGLDCGVFVCAYADYIARDSLETFLGHDVPFLRRRIATEIELGEVRVRHN